MPAVWRVDATGPLPEPGAVVLSCFPSAGLAATVAGHYILRTLALPRIGTILAPEMPPLAVIQAGRVNPPVRAYARKDLVLIMSEFPPPPSLITSLAVAILDGAIGLKAARVLGLEGVVPHPLTDDEEGPPTTEENVWYAGSGHEGLLPEEFRKAGVRLLSDGVIGGVSGALLIESLARTISVGALLVSAREAGYPDHRAAAKLIEVVDQVLPHLEIDTRPLRAQAELIERALRSAMKTQERGEPALVQKGEPSIYQ